MFWRKNYEKSFHKYSGWVESLCLWTLKIVFQEPGPKNQQKYLDRYLLFFFRHFNMNVYRVNYGKVGFLLGNAVDYRLVDESPRLHPCGGPVLQTGPICFANPGRAGPSSDLIFPTSTCSYEGKAFVASTSKTPCFVTGRVETEKQQSAFVNNNSCRYENEKSIVPKGNPDADSNALDWREINRVLENEIKTSAKPCGLVIPADLRKDFLCQTKDTQLQQLQQQPREFAKQYKERTENNTGLFCNPENKNSKNVITGSIVYDSKRKGSKAPASRILLDETRAFGDSSDSDDDDDGQANNQAVLNRIPWQERDSHKGDHQKKEKQYDKSTHQRQENGDQHGEERIPLDFGKIEQRSKIDAESRIIFEQDQDNPDDLFLHIDPRHLNERNETMFRLYGRQNASAIRSEPPEQMLDCARKNVRWAKEQSIRIQHRET